MDGMPPAGPVEAGRTLRRRPDNPGDHAQYTIPCDWTEVATVTGVRSIVAYEIQLFFGERGDFRDTAASYDTEGFASQIFETD